MVWADRLTKTVHNLLQRGESLISGADPAQLFPDLFDGVHLRSIWGKEKYETGNEIMPIS